MVMMAEPRIASVCFIVCVCLWVVGCVLVVEKVWTLFVESRHAFGVCFVALCDCFGRCHLHLVQGEFATDQLGIQGNFQDILGTCFHAAFKDCFAIFKTKEDAVGGKASDWNASGEGFDCWGGHGSCVGHVRKLAGERKNARKIFTFPILFRGTLE
jgi:hypothetical protein